VAELSEIIRLRDEECLSFTDIALRTGLPSRDAAARAYTRAKGAAIAAAELPQPNRRASTGRRIEDILDMPPRPFATTPQQTTTPKRGKFRRAVLLGDIHFPFQDDAALAVARGIIGDVKPDVIVDMGDTLDAYTISRYSKDPNRLHTLQDEIDKVKNYLYGIREIAPQAECTLLDSNHFERLSAVIHGLEGPARELARLTKFREVMNWPALLGLAEIGWRWIPQHQQAHTRIVPKMILKHGTIVRKGSAMSARGEYERYNRSGASGHTHRLGQYYHRDVDGGMVWVETGCLCDMNPSYIADGHADWQQGVTIVTYGEDGKRYAVQQVYIENGLAIYE
jgi:hypothetical protein